MIEAIKRIKFSYALYNFFHKKELIHNEKIYRQLGLNKKYFSPISSKDFETITLEQQNKLTQAISTKNFADCTLFNSLSEESKTSLAHFEDKGFSVLKNYLSTEQVDQINKEIDVLLANKTIKFRYGNKLMFVIHHSTLLQKIATDPALMELLSVCIKGNPVLFQSINFIHGSEQATHSDSIHMTTFPLGGLLGVWIALDDINDENGALHYYPGSHKLPYYLNKDYDNEGSKFLIGDKTYDKYEDMIAEKIKDLHLPKEKFYAKKGDLLIWHANLFHGGDKHLNKDKTRKSVVFHYFREHSICYHEITQRPALLKNFD
jgi:ectoine hydroxylase-related dioxygenase (phytanoyl-CoA dioxygenase family)